ncbi:YheC/YheD family protein [Alicyclobacillus pomorum]|uniref:YheC/YheD family endospore coat-associated protein n=1 Tax=Alicyclobacillus pomorum TaxID=204470 RepID=UPI000404EA07|nr:YheC/YheD family protein [Alicyclobacillus pomorum]
MDKKGVNSRSRKPIVGVLVANTMTRLLNAQNRRFWSYIRFAMLVKANKEAKDTVYIFSPEDVNLSRERVRGTYFNTAKRRWEKKDFPLPDVLYVRGGVRHGASFRNILKEFRRMGIKRINPIYAFDKWDLYQKLSQDENVRPFLPYTERLENIDDLKNVLQNRNEIYIKGCRGSRGKTVMRVVKLPQGGYEYSYFGEKLVRKEVNNIEDLLLAVRTFLGSRRIIVQQAIDLLRADQDSIVDFRAEVQRNKKGEIEIVGIPIRVGQRHSPITIHSSAFKFDDYLGKLLPQYSSSQLDGLKDKIRNFLVSVYSSVEKAYGKFGEIGIDFGLDRDGAIWLIECNAKSAKVSIRKAYGTETLRKTYLNPLQYAKILARKSSPSRVRTRKYAKKRTLDRRTIGKVAAYKTNQYSRKTARQ